MTVLGQIARDVEVSGIRLRVLSEGQGPPLLFLHGSGDLGSWPEILTDLSRHFTIIRPDHPGLRAAKMASTSKACTTYRSCISRSWIS